MKHIVMETPVTVDNAVLTPKDRNGIFYRITITDANGVKWFHDATTYKYDYIAIGAYYVGYKDNPDSPGFFAGPFSEPPGKLNSGDFLYQVQPDGSNKLIVSPEKSNQA